MSQWHRAHPELAGRESDPWMHNTGHRMAFGELLRAGLIECPACGGSQVDGDPDEFGNYDPCPVCEDERA